MIDSQLSLALEYIDNLSIVSIKSIARLTPTAYWSDQLDSVGFEM